MSEMVLPPQRDSYLRPWLITIALVVVGWLAFKRITRPVPVEPFPAPAVTDQGSGWYFILRMPPITSQFESGIETMRVRYGAWLEALKAAGYRPLLFSELRHLTADGAPIPRKSVVLMFDPGFRRTYYIVSPILAQQQWSAVWMSDMEAMNTRHREYISFHQARQMVASGGWDVGLKKRDGTYTFNVGQDENFQIGQRRQGTWSPMSGGVGLNHRGSMFQLNCLNVISDWLPKDLVNRLDAEIPVETPVYFTLGDVQNLLWGTTQATPASFSLAAEPQQRSAIVSWLGTKGIDNTKIRVRGSGLSGTLSFRIRWDEVTLSGLQVSVLNSKVTVQEWKNGEPRAVYKALRTSALDDFNLILLLVGDHLAISVDGSPVAAVQAPIAPSNGKGVAQVYLNDGILGAARVRDLQILFEPLPQSAVVFSTGSESI